MPTMISDLIGFALSYVLIIAVVAVALGAKTLFGLEEKTTRKIIHIGVANWWFIAAGFFTGPLYPSLGAVTFIIANFFLARYPVIPGMSSDSGEKSYGTVYFPITLLAVSLLCFTGRVSMSTGAAAVLVMGYADGLAALAGINFGKHKTFLNRTVEGSAVMIAASFATLAGVAAWYGDPFIPAGFFIIALGAALVELVTPLGLDNISVPLVTGLLYHLVIMA